jgi:hypothetical protein
MMLTLPMGVAPVIVLVDPPNPALTTTKPPLAAPASAIASSNPPDPLTTNSPPPCTFANVAVTVQVPICGFDPHPLTAVGVTVSEFDPPGLIVNGMLVENGMITRPSGNVAEP